MVAVLNAFGVQYVIAGSTAAALHGVTAAPGDLDVVPEPSSKNLERLAAALVDLEAAPIGDPGHWETDAEGERHWFKDPPDAAPKAWNPDAADLNSFDGSFGTRLGNMDVVPELAGSYASLMKKAVSMHIGGEVAKVAHVEDLLATLTVPRRKNDAERVKALREIQRRG